MLTHVRQPDYDSEKNSIRFRERARAAMMKRREIEELIYGKPEQQRRCTQDFPILPEVWIAYAEHPNARIELLLTPHTRSDAATLTRALRDRLTAEGPALKAYRDMHPPAEGLSPRPRILFNESVVFADFTFEELIRVAMPLTDWWRPNVAAVTREPVWTKEVILKFMADLEKG